MIAQKQQHDALDAILSITPEERARKNAAAIAVLRSFLEGDEREQRETFEFLKKALDEDRPSYRKLFAE